MFKQKKQLRVLCADTSRRRLRELTRQIRNQRLSILSCSTASQCLELTARYSPQLLVLDVELSKVDHQDMMEYIHRVSPLTVVVLTAEDPHTWTRRPLFTEKVVARNDYAAIGKVLERISPAGRGS